MNLFYGADKVVADFVAGIIWNDERRFDDDIRAIGVQDNNGALVGGVVYHNWMPHAGTMELSAGATSARWLTRRIVSCLLAYPFHGCGCQMLVGQTETSNERDRKLMCGIGFRETHIPRLFGRDKDGILQTLTDDQWKAGVYYLKERDYEQKFSSKAA